jgi:acyl carrier protein
MSQARALPRSEEWGIGRAPEPAGRHGRLVRELLAAQLRIGAADVDVELSFRELGVDLDDAVVLTALLHRAVGLKIAPPLLFAYRTPSRLIAALDARWVRESGEGRGQGA